MRHQPILRSTTTYLWHNALWRLVSAIFITHFIPTTEAILLMYVITDELMRLYLVQVKHPSSHRHVQVYVTKTGSSVLLPTSTTRISRFRVYECIAPMDWIRSSLVVVRIHDGLGDHGGLVSLVFWLGCTLSLMVSYRLIILILDFFDRRMKISTLVFG